VTTRLPRRAPWAGTAALLLLLLAACGPRSARTFPAGNDGAGSQGYDTPSPDGADSPCSLGQFGACVGESGCGPAAGHLSSVACAESTTVCCAPLDRCTGDESFTCCDSEGGEHRPVCDAPAGTASPPPLACAFGQTRGVSGSCKPTDAGACLRSGEICDPTAPACCPGTQCVPAEVPDDGGSPSPPHCA
jgi:hypothetical protein